MEKETNHSPASGHTNGPMPPLATSELEGNTHSSTSDQMIKEEKKLGDVSGHDICPPNQAAPPTETTQVRVPKQPPRLKTDVDDEDKENRDADRGKQKLKQVIRGALEAKGVESRKSDQMSTVVMRAVRAMMKDGEEIKEVTWKKKKP